MRFDRDDHVLRSVEHPFARSLIESTDTEEGAINP
jgi:hypothetical protein